MKNDLCLTPSRESVNHSHDPTLFFSRFFCSFRFPLCGKVGKIQLEKGPREQTLFERGEKPLAVDDGGRNFDL